MNAYKRPKDGVNLRQMSEGEGGMKAAFINQCGGPEEIQFGEIPKPTVKVRMGENN